MNKIYTLLLFLFFSSSLIAQYEFRVSMGLNFTAMPSVRDYINENFAGADQLRSFNSSVEFAFEAGYEIKEKYQAGLELAYETSSFTFTYFPSNYVFDYNILSPSLLGYYIIKGDGYKFKLGGGVGPRFLSVKETKYTNQPIKYNSTGVGFVLKADGNTRLSDIFYAFIGVDLRYNLCGEPEGDNSNNIIHNGKSLNIKSISTGIKLGVSIIL